MLNDMIYILIIYLLRLVHKFSPKSLKITEKITKNYEKKVWPLTKKKRKIDIHFLRELYFPIDQKILFRMI
jgi:hypothetical protein